MNDQWLRNVFIPRRWLRNIFHRLTHRAPLANTWLRNCSASSRRNLIFSCRPQQNQPTDRVEATCFVLGASLSWRTIKIPRRSPPAASLVPVCVIVLSSTKSVPHSLAINALATQRERGNEFGSEDVWGEGTTTHCSVESPDNNGRWNPGHDLTATYSCRQTLKVGDF